MKQAGENEALSPAESEKTRNAREEPL